MHIARLARSPSRHLFRGLSLVLVVALGLGDNVAPVGGRVPSVTDDVEVIESPPAHWIDDPWRSVLQEPRSRVVTSTTERTNIVVVMLDDLPAMDDVIWSKLPTIRSMFLNRGIRFSDFHGETPLCCPGRANFLTGLHTHHHGVIDNDARLLDPSMTLATQLQDAGYFTAISGKYLNQMSLLRSKHPPGWTRSAIMNGAYYDYTMWLDGQPTFHDNDENDYSTDVVRNHALRFIRSAPAHKPLFAMLTPYAVHAGFDAARVKHRNLPVPAPRHEEDARCTGMTGLVTPAYNEQDVSDKPAYVRSRPLTNGMRGPEGWPLQPLCESLLSVDAMLSDVRAELKAQGRLRRTLFILTADNGMTFGAHRLPKKNSPYATGIPFFARWPERLGNVPATIDETLSNIDVAPTLCEVAGCTLGPYATGQAGPDGMSFLRLLLERGGDLERDAILQSHPLASDAGLMMPPWYGLRTTAAHGLGRWHYVEYATGERELYDLTADPWELDNRAGLPEYAQEQRDLRRKLDEILAEPTP